MPAPRRKETHLWLESNDTLKKLLDDVVLVCCEVLLDLGYLVCRALVNVLLRRRSVPRVLLPFTGIWYQHTAYRNEVG